MRCGYVAIIGRPNVGKSTLLNRILKEKISITADKPQTTRDQILGIKTIDETQVIYVDTPGLHQGKHRALNRAMNQTAQNALQDVDAVIFVIEGNAWREEDEWVLSLLEGIKKPVILAINKIDKIKDRSVLLPFLEELQKKFPFHALVPISAEHGKNVPELEKVIADLLPEQIHLYPADQITDRSERYLVRELIREKIVRLTGEELPYATAVQIEAYHETKKLLRVAALIWVERSGQKAIIIGEKGSKLKAIGQQTRLELEAKLEKSVYIELWVKIRKNWSDDHRALGAIGFENPE